jgi:mRNA interferase RelE/StbE
MTEPWTVLHGRRFYRELAQVPAGVRQRAEELAFGETIRQDPFLGGRAERLRGHPECYKIRIGEYRIGLLIDPARRVIDFRRILHRREIYRYFP